MPVFWQQRFWLTSDPELLEKLKAYTEELKVPGGGKRQQKLQETGYKNYAK